jgi:hypothetical protein
MGSRGAPAQSPLKSFSETRYASDCGLDSSTDLQSTIWKIYQSLLMKLLKLGILLVISPQ